MRPLPTTLARYSRSVGLVGFWLVICCLVLHTDSVTNPILIMFFNAIFLHCLLLTYRYIKVIFGCCYHEEDQSIVAAPDSCKFYYSETDNRSPLVLSTMVVVVHDFEKLTALDADSCIAELVAGLQNFYDMIAIVAHFAWCLPFLDTLL